MNLYEDEQIPGVPPRGINLKFQLAQRVRIIEIDRPGRIVSILLCSEGHQFKVAYCNNGERKEEWLFPGEIEEPKT